MEKREVLFSKTVRAGKRTYFFDVKETQGGDKYLVISESKEAGEGRHEHFRVMVFDDALLNFTDGLKEAVKFIRPLSS